MKSLLSDVDIPSDISCSDFLLKSIRQHANAGKVAMVDSVTGKELSYRQLEKDVVQLSRALWKIGLRKGDVLCIICPNCSEYPVLILSTLACGASVTLASASDTGDEIKYQLSTSGAKYMVMMAAIADKIETVLEDYGKIEMANVIIIGDSAGFTTTLESLMRDECPSIPPVFIDPQRDVAAMPFSSGTTGLRKGVMLTHFNLVANVCQLGHPDIIIGAPLVGRNTLVCVLPFFHIYGLIVILLRNLVDGERMIVMPRFELSAYLKIIEDYKVTLLHVVPPIAVAMAKNRELCQKYDLSSVKIILSGAAPLKKDTSDQFELVLPRVLMKQGYGLTEASPTLHVSLLSCIKPGSIGVLVPNTECKLVDIISDEEVGPNEVGELLVKGPQVMKGYINNPGATAAMFRDGWMRTGDLAKYDEEGHFYIVDRIKELIKYKGYQVAPAYLEEILLSHPSVVDAAVIGIDDATAGELPCACVVKAAGADVTQEEIMRFVEDRVSQANKLRGGVKFISSIPKSPSGKILHRILKQHFGNTSANKKHSKL